MSYDPSAIDSYLQHTKEKVEQHKILSKLHELVNEGEYLSAVDSSKALNKLDDQLYQIFTRSEK